MPLTDIKIRQAKPSDKPVKLADTAGLYLEVKPSGSKLWRYRYRIAGREYLFAIGEYPQVSLADARKARDDARELIRQGRPSSTLPARKLLIRLESRFNPQTTGWLASRSGSWL